MDMSGKSERTPRRYLRERARIARLEAEGKIVVSDDEVSDEQLEKLDQMLRAAGFDRSRADVIEAVR
jgi:hypothetical protein